MLNRSIIFLVLLLCKTQQSYNFHIEILYWFIQTNRSDKYWYEYWQRTTTKKI